MSVCGWVPTAEFLVQGISVKLGHANLIVSLLAANIAAISAQVQAIQRNILHMGESIPCMDRSA